MEIRCCCCGKKPEELEEYIEGAHEEGMTPEAYVQQEEGTFDPDTGGFACSPCYIRMGMPTRPYPDSWRAPAFVPTETDA